MALEPETLVAQRIESEFGVRFGGASRSLGPWGQADNCLDLPDGTFAVLEVEARQKHPCTNVLKLWPYLAERRLTKALLIQAFFDDSPGLNSNRGHLGTWLAGRMASDLGDRFQYCRLVLGRDGSFHDGLDNLAAALRKSGEPT